jgi:hypothetical protein
MFRGRFAALTTYCGQHHDGNGKMNRHLFRCSIGQPAIGTILLSHNWSLGLHAPTHLLLQLSVLILQIFYARHQRIQLARKLAELKNSCLFLQTLLNGIKVI